MARASRLMMAHIAESERVTPGSKDRPTRGAGVPPEDPTHLFAPQVGRPLRLPGAEKRGSPILAASEHTPRDLVRAEGGTMNAVPRAVEEFRGLDTGDRRLDRRVLRCIERFDGASGRTLPEIFPDPSELEAYYRLTNNEKVTVDKLLAPHEAATVERALQYQRVLSSRIPACFPSRATAREATSSARTRLVSSVTSPWCSVVTVETRRSASSSTSA